MAARNRGSLQRGLFRSRPAFPPRSRRAGPQIRSDFGAAGEARPTAGAPAAAESRAPPRRRPCCVLPGAWEVGIVPQHAHGQHSGLRGMKGRARWKGRARLCLCPRGPGAALFSMAPRPRQPCLAGAGEAHAPRSCPSPRPTEPGGFNPFPPSGNLRRTRCPRGPSAQAGRARPGVGGSPSSSLPCLVLPG